MEQVQGLNLNHRYISGLEPEMPLTRFWAEKCWANIVCTELLCLLLFCCWHKHCEVITNTVQKSRFMMHVLWSVCLFVWSSNNGEFSRNTISANS